MRALRTETGLRLLLISLVVSLVSAAVTQAVETGGRPAASADDLWWHIASGAIYSSLTAATGVAALLGILVIEWNRGDLRQREHPLLDTTRIAGGSSVVAGGFIFFSGLVLGFVYLADARPLADARLWADVVLAVSSGLYLFWTSQRIDPATKPLARIAFGLGLLSVVLSMASGAALTAIVSNAAVGIFILTLTGANMLSLVAWIVVYGGILGRLRSSGGATPFPVEA